MAEAVTKEAIERDIDGLPLKDHPRVDLKAILGHSPPIDDDDPAPEGGSTGNASLQVEDFTIVENEDEDNGLDEDASYCLAARQRRSSLRTQQGGGGGGGDPPDSPTGDRKGVRFADSLGLGLAAIRDVGDDEEPPEIPHSALTALRIRRRRGQADGGKVMVLVPAFETPDPAAEDGGGFLDRVAARNVLLESCFVSSRELTVSGVVRVKNFESEKTVSVRYTTDDWSTHRDVPASYVPNSNDGRTDRFVFIVHLPEGFGAEEGEAETEEGSLGSPRGGRLQLAVAFRVGGDTFWDNNDGDNYVIDCVMRNREPSISGESAVGQ